MQAGDLVRVRRQLFWGSNQPRGPVLGCLALVIEVRNDLIATEAQQQAWAARLAPLLVRALAVVEG